MNKVDPVVKIMRRIAKINPKLKDVMKEEIRIREDLGFKEKWFVDWKVGGGRKMNVRNTPLLS